MKPHVPACYAEDLWLLQQLAEHLSSGGREYEFASKDVIETLDEVRLLLEREVDFRREQATLAEVGRVYNRPGAHAPNPIPELCADTITAMSLERGVKVTEAHRLHPLWRRRAATKIVEALIADPILSSDDDAVFHADPHAGNLLYDEAKNELIVLDWALTGRLSRDERRHLARLIIMMTFRDSSGVRAAIHALSRSAGGAGPETAEAIDRCVDRFFGGLPHACSLGALDAMRLLDRIGLEGVRFPGSLVLIRKVLFTLDGVLRDVAGQDVRLDAVVAREFFARWFKQFGWLPAPFKLSDLLAVERSALFYISGLWSWTAKPALAPPSAASQ
jgi:ubiquinone biosynthesis protein